MADNFSFSSPTSNYKPIDRNSIPGVNIDWQKKDQAAQASKNAGIGVSPQQANYDAAIRTESAVQGTGLPAENFTTSPSGEITPAIQVVPDNQTTSFGTNRNDYTFKNPMEESLKSKYEISTTDALGVARDKDGNIGFKPDGSTIDKVDTSKPFSVPEKNYTAKDAKDIAKSTTTANEQKAAAEKKLKDLAAKQNAFNKAKYTHTSAYTDADIINITPEYIISFTLQDTDKEVYNMYQIGGDAFMGILDPKGDNNVASICASVPDLSSIIQFGMRPHPGTIQSPLVQNQAEAQKLGMMLVLQSMANRLTGTLTAIDEPTLRVGDPIRIHMYDEHPHKPVTVTLVEEKEENASEKSNTTEEGEEKRKKTETVTNTGTPTPAFDPLVFPEQAVFYVTNVERSIDPSGTSTMTLQLKAGRMMGAWSVYEIFQSYYRNYYWWDVQHRDDYLDGNNPLGDEKTDKKSPYWQYDHSIKDNSKVQAQQSESKETKASQEEKDSKEQPENKSEGGATDAQNTPKEQESDKSDSTEEQSSNPPTHECGGGSSQADDSAQTEDVTPREEPPSQPTEAYSDASGIHPPGECKNCSWSPEQQAEKDWEEAQRECNCDVYDC